MRRGFHGREFAPFICGLALCTTCRPESSHEDVPEFVADRVSDALWEFDCPCGRRHQHSAGAGHCVAHCAELSLVSDDVRCPCGKRGSAKWMASKAEHVGHVEASDWHVKTGYNLI